MMKGKLALDFGAQAKAVGELAASWIDVDTLLAAAAPANAQSEPSTADVLNAAAERALDEAASVGDGALTVKLDQASIGGDLVGALDLAMAAKDGVVTVERLNAELPGENRIEASGRLTRGEGGPVFEGPIKLEGSKLKTLARWAAGDREMSGQATVGAFTLSAKTTLGAGNLMLDDATGELSGTKFSGALHYRGGERRIVDLTLAQIEAVAVECQIDDAPLAAAIMQGAAELRAAQLAGCVVKHEVAGAEGGLGGKREGADRRLARHLAVASGPAGEGFEL